jgi:uncharacterized phage protein (TIGR02218 family)
MTYDAQETSTESGQPVELYAFALGANTYRYTSSELPFTDTGFTYNPEAIERSQLVMTTDDKTERLEVRMPSSTTFAQQFKSTAPGFTATLTIYRVHRTDGAEEVKLYFKGVVGGLSFTANGRKAIVMALPFTSLKAKEIPRYTFQNLCNYALFDGDCKVSEASFSHLLACTAVSDNVITLTGAGALGADYFEAGFVEYLGEYRLVLSQSTNDLTLLLPFTSDPTGSNVNARAGCKKRLSEDCNTKFSNPINYGGYKWVPKKNPFETGLS